MKKLIVFFILASFAMTAQVKENRSTNTFNKISVSQGIAVKYSVSNTTKIVVEATDEELLGQVKTEVANGVLKVYIQSNKNSWNMVNIGKSKEINVYIDGPNLDEVSVSSSGKFIATSTLKTVNFNLIASSSGQFKAAVKAQRCTVAISSSAKVNGDFYTSDWVDIKCSSSGLYSGVVNTKELRMGTSSSGKIEVSGDVNQVKAELSSSSKISAQDLKTNIVNVSASSSASARFSVTDEIDAKASSSAKISYTGNPSRVKVKKSSSGKIVTNG